MDVKTLRGPARWEAVYRAYVKNGATYQTVGRELGLSYTQVKWALEQYRTHNGIRGWLKVHAENTLPRSPIQFGEYVYTGLESESVQLPRFTGEPHIEGNCIVTGDFQLPTTDFELAERVLTVAQALNVKTLLVVGDWVNLDAFSRYDHIVPPIPLATEISVSVQLMSRYAAWFDVIWLALGNHEHRLLKLARGDLTGSMLGRLLSTAQGKLRVTPYSHIVIHSGGQTWRATHQVNYSKIKGRVGDELAQKYQCNVITHHQHHAAKLMDRYGRYVVIDNGGLFDPDKMSYVKLRDSTSVGMTKGFTVILEGTGHLITPYPAFTDINLWLRLAGQERAAV